MKSHILFRIVIVVLSLWAVLWLFYSNIEDDEVERWHAAWLMHQGQQPFNDFFEHHCPTLCLLLKSYFDLFGENYGIILVSRILWLLVFTSTALLSYSIVRHWASPQGAWISALAFPLYSFSLLHAHLFVRGDPLILLILIFTIWLSLPLLEDKSFAKHWLLRLLAIFVCLGLTLAISIRAAIPSLTIFGVLAFFAFRSIPTFHFLLVFLIGGIISLLPLAVLAWYYGLEQFVFWVIQYNAAMYPPFSPVPILGKLAISASPIWLLVGFAFYRLIRDPEIRQKSAFWLAVIMSLTNFAGLWATTQPNMHHFLMCTPFFGFLAGAGYDEFMRIMRSRFNLPTWNFAGLILVGGFILLGAKSYFAWTRPSHENQSTWIQRAQWFINYTTGEDTFTGDRVYYHPIFILDNFYYWHHGLLTTQTMERIQPNFRRYTFEDLSENPPTILHESFAQVYGFMKSPAYNSWLQMNYDTSPYQGYYVKKPALLGE